MPKTDVLLYREEDGTIPLLAWLQELQKTNQAAFKKCVTLVDYPAEFGRDLRRPRADILRDGIYELRTQVRNVNYRLLYGFVGKDVAMLSHGLTKERTVPSRDIDLAVTRLQRFKQNPKRHTATKEELNG